MNLFKYREFLIKKRNLMLDNTFIYIFYFKKIKKIDRILDKIDYKIFYSKFKMYKLESLIDKEFKSFKEYNDFLKNNFFDLLA